MRRAAALLLAVPVLQGQAGEPAKPYKIGSRIEEEIVLVDLEGKPRRLLEETDRDEDLIVLVFWTLRDPLAHAYEERLTKLRDDFAPQGVKLFLVDSNHDELVSPASDPLEKIRAYVKETKLDLPILLDHGNRVADDFGALTSNHAFVIDRARWLRYSGGIDDDPKEELPERKPWLRLGIEAALQGENAKDCITRPIGRRIHRAPQLGDEPKTPAPPRRRGAPDKDA
jgi:hypothetical protein